LSDNNMHGRGLTLLCLASLIAASAHADEFSWELRLSVRSSDVSESVDGEGATLGATYFFQPIDDGQGPYDFAAFLSRSSRIGASYGEDKTTSVSPVVVLRPPFTPLPPPPQPAVVTVVDRAAGRSLFGRHVWRSSGWYVGGAFIDTEAADPAPLPTQFSLFGEDLRSGAVTFGKYLGKATALDLTYAKAEATRTSSFSLFCNGGLCALSPLVIIAEKFETDAENVAISAQHVASVGAMHYALSGSVAANESKRMSELIITPVVPAPVTFPLPPLGGVVAVNPAALGSPVLTLGDSHAHRYAVAGELFPTNALGILLGYARWDGDEVLDHSVELAATWFFKRRFGARVVLAKTKTDLPIDTVQDVESATLELIGRL
jgi:hypothetical protein